MSNILIVKDLVKSYQKERILDQTSFSIEKNTIVALLAPSGSGKSTLLHVIGLLDVPDSGDIIFNGLNITLLPDSMKAQIRLSHIGFIYQFHHLLPELNVLENVMLPLWMSGKHNIRKQAMDLLCIFGLENRLFHNVAHLSGGEKQRVAVARALINNPDLVLADEPTGNLDLENARLVVSYLVKILKERQKSALIVTHDEYIARKADRIFSLKHGKILL